MPTPTYRPLNLAWDTLSTSNPMTTHTDEPRVNGACDICGTSGDVMLMHRIVSENFTDWDTLPRGTRYGCETCCWGYLTGVLRTKCYLLNKTTSEVLTLAKTDTQEWLLQPLPEDTCLTVPLSGRKHLLPNAQWGHLSTDQGTFLWNIAAADLMKDFRILREAGVTDDHLHGYAVPPKKVLLTAGTWTAWENVKPWKSSPYYYVASRVSRLWIPTPVAEKELPPPPGPSRASLQSSVGEEKTAS